MKFFFDGDGKCCFHTVFYSVLCFSHDVITPPPPHPPSVNDNETFNVTPSSNQATFFRIQHHPTHFTWRYYTPPTPPTPPSVNNNETSNVATSSNHASNIFQDSTSSNALHMTLLHPPHPPHPPICIQERPFWYSIKTEGSSKLRGTPSLEPLYIYTYNYIYIYIHTYVYIYIYVYRIHIWEFCQRCGESVCVLEILKQSKTPLWKTTQNESLI